MNTYSEVSKKKFLGAVFLISGSCIGAGMLGLPVLSALTGFIPSSIIFFFCWLFMTCTGLLVLEVNLWFKDEVNFITMAGKTLGKVGQAVGWITFLFLFYCLNVAYVSGIGSLVSELSHDITGIFLPQWGGSLLFIGLFGVFIFIGTWAVDGCNRFLMLGLILSYGLLIVTGSHFVDSDLLKHKAWENVFLVVPAMILSFGFHNLVPSLTTYLKQDKRLLRLAIIAGSLIPLLIYLVWQWLILGIIPIEGEQGFVNALSTEELVTQTLRNAIGSPWVIQAAQAFAFFAIVTSFIGVALSFVDFLADGLKIKKTSKGKLLLILLTLLPPLLFSLFYPSIFLTALRYAGGFGAVILFGILPVLMVWIGRYRHGLIQHQMVPGGKISLTIIFITALAIILLQTAQEIGWLTAQNK